MKDDCTLAILRLKGVLRKTGLTRSGLYRAIAQGLFPTQVSLGPRCVGWIESEVDAWIHAQIERSRKSQFKVALSQQQAKAAR